LASDQIWHGGQIVAVVLAETFEAAREAAHLLKVTYAAEQLSARFDSVGATTVAAKDVSSNYEDPAVGDAEATFAGAPVTIDADYATPTRHHNRNRAVHHELRLGRRQVDGVGGQPERHRPQKRPGRAARHRPREGPRWGGEHQQCQ
jgi:CO/xanthine dehydrogenase Mo-binding subunit